jgi:hypothetical protein
MKFLFLKKLFLKHRNKQGYDFILKSQLPRPLLLARYMIRLERIHL